MESVWKCANVFCDENFLNYKCNGQPDQPLNIKLVFLSDGGRDLQRQTFHGHPHTSDSGWNLCAFLVQKFWAWISIHACVTLMMSKATKKNTVKR